MNSINIINNLDQEAREHVHDYEKDPIPGDKICGLCYHHFTVVMQDALNKVNEERKSNNS